MIGRNLITLHRFGVERLQTEGWHEPYESRGSRTDLWGTGGEIPPVYPARDEGRSLVADLQELASNHLKLLRSNAGVVSVNCATKLQRRWRVALRSRSAGGGFKPPQAAVGKSHGSEL